METTAGGFSNPVLWMLRLDANGNVGPGVPDTWQHTYGQTAGVDVHPDLGGGFFLYGEGRQFTPYGTGAPLYVVTDGNGEVTCPTPLVTDTSATSVPGNASVEIWPQGPSGDTCCDDVSTCGLSYKLCPGYEFCDALVCVPKPVDWLRALPLTESVTVMNQNGTSLSPVAESHVKYTCD
jgi:hypothetical protein